MSRLTIEKVGNANTNGPPPVLQEVETPKPQTIINLPQQTYQLSQPLPGRPQSQHTYPPLVQPPKPLIPQSVILRPKQPPPPSLNTSTSINYQQPLANPIPSSTVKRTLPPFPSGQHQQQPSQQPQQIQQQQQQQSQPQTPLND